MKALNSRDMVMKTWIITMDWLKSPYRFNKNTQKMFLSASGICYRQDWVDA